MFPHESGVCCEWSLSHHRAGDLGFQPPKLQGWSYLRWGRFRWGEARSSVWEDWPHWRALSIFSASSRWAPGELPEGLDRGAVRTEPRRGTETRGGVSRGQVESREVWDSKWYGGQKSLQAGLERE